MDIINKNTTLHVGMPKCASTTLQRNFFKCLPLINYGGIDGDSELSKLVNDIAKKDGLYYNEEFLKHKLHEEIDKTKPFVISNEHGSGMKLPLTQNIPQGRKVIAERYKRLFPNAKILIIIRNQFHIQRSIYIETLSSNNLFIPLRKLTFKKWLELNVYQYNRGWNNTFEFSDYYPFVKFYKDNFEEVKVVLFEEMIKDMEGFIKNELSSFIGISGEEAIQYYKNTVLNKRHTRWEIFFERFIRDTINFLQKRLGYPQKIISKNKRIAFMKMLHQVINSISVGHIKTNYTNEHKKFMVEFYGDNNRELSKLIDVDLKTYGYPL